MSTEASRLGAPVDDDLAARGGVRRLALAVDRAIGVAAELAGAVLVLAEIVILFSGVVSRYVFNSPLIWSDELANFLFLWLAMCGTIVALRRDEHMRLTIVVGSVAPRWGDRLNAVAALVVIAFVQLPRRRALGRLFPGGRDRAVAAP
jgi:TRAP-type C4-dicarboxylate transport system permease small subunit